MSEEVLQITGERREAKSKVERDRYAHLNAEFQRKARSNKKDFLNQECKDTEENDRMGKISSRKLEIPREHFMQGWVQ